jgi:hypothetical protein
LLLLGLTQPALAQSPTPPPTLTPREALIQEIQARAQRDVELDKPPKDIAGLEILFGEDAAAVGLSMTEVLNIYEEAYTHAKPPEPWWADLRPEAGWIAAAILFVLFILRDVLKENLTKFFNWLGERIYRWLSQYRPFWGIALRRYRKALIARYEQLKIPFRTGRPLDMREVYVPLKMTGAPDTDLVDAHHAVSEHKWLMVVGAPGAGKTMLFKRLALRYAEGELVDFPTQPVPVLLELNRLSETEKSLEAHLAQVMQDNDFPGGERFLAAGLERGFLLLLLDGLDEVASEARGRVTRQIKDLLRAHPDCQAVITSRPAAYDGEFDDMVDQRLEIARFSDQQIQGFLSSWEPEMPLDKSPAHLLRNLHERPHIMRLARNPLLLTIIAYLYADTPFVLPHSRSAFYDKAITVLLEQWDRVKGKHNQFTADEKQLVLQHLALFNQESAAAQGRDRRTVDLPTVLDEVKKVLPSVNRQPEDARPLLDEVVERSGLLLALDGGLRYQFTHLTLQEFFAARELQDDAETLIVHFEADPDAWRETVKLWCGLAHDSTDLIRAIYTDHPIMAFECLGDAQKVESDFANEVIAAFEARLGESGPGGEEVTDAFATVATNPQTRGQRIFDFLTAAATDMDSDPTRRLAAAQALALTNLPQAAGVLGECALDHAEMRPLLTQVGGLATPILAKWAEQGHEWALDGLQTVGTPQATCALADLLWTENGHLSYQAAWHLAALLPNAGVEEALREHSLTPEQRDTDTLDWVWEPFEPDAASDLRVIAGRVAHLLQTTPPAALPEGEPQPLDPRLVIPLCATATEAERFSDLEKEKREPIEENLQDLLEQLSPPKTVSPAPTAKKPVPSHEMTEQERFIAQALDEIGASLMWRRLFRSLDISSQFDLLHRFIKRERMPTTDDWRNIFQPVEYEFEGSWHAWGIKAALFILLILSLCEVLITFTPQLMVWEKGIYGLLGLGLLWAAGWLVQKRLNLYYMELLTSCSWCGFGIYMGWLASSAWGPLKGGLISVALFAALSDMLEKIFSNVMVYVLGLMREAAPFGALGGALSIAVFVALFGKVTNLLNVALFTVLCVGLCSAAVITLIGIAISRKAGEVAGAQVDEVGARRGAWAGARVGLQYGAQAGVMLGMASSFMYLLYFLSTQALHHIWGIWSVVGFWVTWGSWYIGLWWVGARREQRAQNPLQGLLEMQKAYPAQDYRYGLMRRLGWPRFLHSLWTKKQERKVNEE